MPPAASPSWSVCTIWSSWPGSAGWSAVGPHHIAAQGRMAHQESGVHRGAAVEAVQELSERLPIPGQPLLQRWQGHPPPPWPSSLAGIGRRRDSPGPARTRSCPPAQWSPRASATAWPPDPRTTGRRNGYGGSMNPGATTSRRHPPSEPPPPSTCPNSAIRPREIATSATTGADPVPSTTVPPRITRSNIPLTVDAPYQPQTVGVRSNCPYGNTVSVSRPERRRVPGVAPVGPPAGDDLGAVDQNVLYADGAGIEALAAAGEVGALHDGL